MKESGIRGIFFDLGNVLVGIDSIKFAEQMRSMTGLEPGELLSAFTGGLVLDYECGRMDENEFLAGLCERTGVAITREGFTNAWTSMFLEAPLLPDKLLQGLARRYTLWAISNTNRMHFEFIRERYPILMHFHGWSLSYEVGAAKPDPAIFAHALERTRISAAEALFIDDQRVNVEAARNLGIDAVQFLNSAQLVGELRARNLIDHSETP